ncbi:pyridoxamine 5'-phosphate oxidase family protein [Parafannyhessea sp. LCP19S3_B1]|uniref:pyridoxamine 5'-phosphate oxidase family protein n=1 Tax=Parafannyhessea sp. LCP19S3_B1 TaxID=3438795 RepID=UPI003F970EF9
MADINDVFKFFKSESPTYFLATDDGGQPRVRPFGTVDLFEGRLYIQTGKKKDVYRQLLANPKAEICGVSGGDWWRVSGELVPDDRVEAKRHMLDAYPALRKMYDENDDNTIVLYFKNATARFCSMSGKPAATVEL